MIDSPFGHYEIQGLLGVGGMGEVYRAVDTRLKRAVAIKILPEAFSHDPGRLERFQREAEVLATLNHSNIAVVYGLEESSGVRAIVLELVEGDTLADRIARGPLPLEDAIDIATQIADALEAAHDKGVIHRDLKPANIKINPDGKVKVLDFGLAKVIEHEPSISALTLSPTLAVQGTNAGVILGTASYMSPEQARGKPLDKRTDVWAFGCVLFEMLTGRKAFAGDDVSEILAFVITKEPDWAALPANAPGAIRKLLRRCLEKDRKRRLADVADARFELEEARHGPHAPLVPATSASPPSRRREYLWAVAALVFVITSGVLAVRSVFTPVPEAATVRFDVSAPEGARIDRTSTSISPDGRKVSYVATFESRTLIWVRRLDTSTAQPLPGTENASRPFWSPDSQFLAFFAQGKLKRIAATGGPIQVVCGLSGTATYNGTWNSRGVILFAANDQGPILRVSAAGGQSTPATVLNASLKENRHSYPNFLPDGRHFLYLSSGDVRLTYVGTLDSGERHALPGIVSEAKYSSMGYLMFLQNGSLVARRFDVGRLELSEEPLQIAEQFGAGPLAPFSVSMNGDIAHLSLGAATSQLAWFDRAGKQLALVGPAGEYRNPELSPDGRFVAFERGAPADIWVLDIQKGLTSRFTSNAAADTSPVWSPDGRTIAFATDRDTQVNIGQGNIYERAFGVVGEDKLLLKTDAPKNPMDWSRDGRHLVFDAGLDVWALPLTDDRKPFRVTETPSTEMQARMSTDGRWIAYASTESGRFEVYIQSFPRPGIKQQVSTMGGEAPRWKRDGSELFYLAPDSTLMAAAITPAGSSLEMGTPRPLFQSGLGFFTAVDPRNRAQYDVDHDGRFLMGVTSAEQSMRITVILNWMGR